MGMLMPVLLLSSSHPSPQARDQCDLLLLDYDKQVESTCMDSQREVKTCQDSISTMYKLELMKMPVDVKNMNIDEYFKQVGTCLLHR